MVIKANKWIFNITSTKIFVFPIGGEEKYNNKQIIRVKKNKKKKLRKTQKKREKSISLFYTINYEDISVIVIIITQCWFPYT